MKMTDIKRLALLLLAVLTAAATSGCTTYDNFRAAFFSAEEETAESVKIGVFEPLTGADAAEASEEIKGIELAHEMFPQVAGKDVELVYADNQSDVEMAKIAAQQLVDAGVLAVLGSYKSTLSLAGSDIFKSADLPAIGISCTNPLVTQTSEYYFRVCFVDAFQGISAANYVFEKLGLSDAVCLKQAGDDYAEAMIEQFEERMSALTAGLGKVTIIEYPSELEDVTAYVKRIASIGAEAVFFPSSIAQGSKFLMQASELDVNWIGCAKWEGIAENALPSETSGLDYLEGVCYVKGFDAASSFTTMTERFKAAYAKKYPAEAPSEACALGFDAYLMALKGIELSEGSGSGIIITGKLKSIRELEGATGYISINSQGDPIKDVVIEKIIDGKATAVYTVKPD